MKPLALFLSGITLVWSLAALLPVLWRKTVNISLSLILVTNLVAAGYSALIWLGNLRWGKTHIPIDFWSQFTQDLKLPVLQLEFNIDPLSAFFIFLVTSFSALVAVYSFKALKAPHYQNYAHWITSAFSGFTWSTVMVLVAHDGISLLVSLELMTLFFGYLALYKHFLYQDDKDHVIELEKKRKALIAPQVYLIISHTSTVFLLLSVMLLALYSGGWSYGSFIEKGKESEQQIAELVTKIEELDSEVRSLKETTVSSEQAQNTELINLQNELEKAQQDRQRLIFPLTMVFIFSLIGIGIRAGLTPAHIWVSLVHPSSPTTTHALSLGIAIKVAIYLMYRFFFQFLPPQSGWGYLLLVVSVATALVNVWYAISSHDLKEALAYHSIENIGIISAGIGFGLIFWEQNRPLAYLGLIASLYHLVNHAVFKGLLYLATGAIDNLTHQTVDIDRLGGLIHKYRFTASMFLIGSFAISGFPPFNGFISEWLLMQTGLVGLYNLHGNFIGSLVILLSLLLLVMSFALTAFCFYKIAGIALLGMPRLPEKERADWEKDDVHISLKGVMGIMALLTLLLGIFPGLIAPQLVKAFESLGMPRNIWNQNQVQWFKFQLPAEFVPHSSEYYSLPLEVLVVILLLLIVAALLRGQFRSHVSVQRPQLPWDCGTPIPEQPVHQYSSGALSYSLRKLFTSKEVIPFETEYLPSQLVLSKSKSNPQRVIEIFRDSYNRIVDRLLNESEDVGKKIQNRDIRSYLKYVFAFTVIIFILYWLTSVILKASLI